MVARDCTFFLFPKLSTTCTFRPGLANCFHNLTKKRATAVALVESVREFSRQFSQLFIRVVYQQRSMSIGESMGGKLSFRRGESLLHGGFSLEIWFKFIKKFNDVSSSNINEIKSISV